MNETIETILKRRSVRKYDKKQIEEDKLDLIIKCAKHAPSGNNEQPWAFTIIQSSALIDKMSKDIFTVNKEKGNKWYQGKYYSPLYDAPTVIIISRKDDDKTCSYFDCCLATENICLAATSLGIGSCIIIDIMPIFEEPLRESYYKELKIPKGYVPQISIALGYPNEKARSKKINDSIINRM